ncbi:hypothetical protein CoNPh17_CDS0161 [Staphylococcus phage S-CoN_Ph17]|nr:hypothetical protein CoNPh17_CDS0161 [Staphylococcus phage S-CoN_Ph17]
MVLVVDIEKFIITLPTISFVLSSINNPLANSKERFYMPIGHIEDKQDKIKNEKNFGENGG